MLRDWVRNMPLATLQTIVADVKARGCAVWMLASAELARRLAAEGQPAAGLVR